MVFVGEVFILKGSIWIGNRKTMMQVVCEALRKASTIVRGRTIVSPLRSRSLIGDRALTQALDSAPAGNGPATLPMGTLHSWGQAGMGRENYGDERRSYRNGHLVLGRPYGRSDLC